MPQSISPILTLLVNNEFGVLTRVCSTIRREGWNIKSLNVAETTDPTLSRVTLSIECYHMTMQSVVIKLKRMDCVRSALPYDPESFLCREYVLIRLCGCDRQAFDELNKTYCAKVLEDNDGTIRLEYVSDPDGISEFISRLCEIGRVEAVRTGAITLEKEEHNV